VLIVFRPDGRGGIQGIVLDSFYIDRDGKIANEFYIVRDCDEGIIERIEDPSIRKVEDQHLIQKVFFQYFLNKSPALPSTDSQSTASNYQK